MPTAVVPHDHPAFEADDRRLMALLARIADEKLWLGDDRFDARRRACRHAVSTPIRVYDFHQGLVASSPEPAWATDLSLHGLGFLVQYPVHTGQTLVADLGELAEDGLLLKIRIAYCQQLLDHTYRAGASFVFTR